MRHRMFSKVSNKAEQKMKAMELIKQVTQKLQQEYGSKATDLIKKIESREEDFTQALANASTADFDRVVKQYICFAVTLDECVTAPAKVDEHSSNYFSGYYHPVGIVDIQHITPTTRKLAIAGCILGFSLMLASIPLFLFTHPAIGSAVLGAGILLVGSCAGVLNYGDTLDPSKKQLEERTIFNDTATLIQKPSPKHPDEFAHRSPSPSPSAGFLSVA